MKKLISCLAAASVALGAMADETPAYIPTAENLKARQEFADNGFGIFLHWGLYSMFAQGEWYLNYDNITAKEYAKAAGGFYPANFDAAKWVSAIKDSGAKYITFTTRHHDGFSMWDTDQSDYNIVDATPFKRDILKELADECEKQGIKLHLYYSHIDWTRPDYPSGRTGLNTGRDTTLRNWPAYYDFMNKQLTELLTNYGKVGAIWFDGYWDHDQDSVPFDWQLPEQYALIHSLQPACLIGNNHHVNTHPGEDIQIFERDLPGENTAGLSGQDISRLPLETCNTMNGMWGYKILDQNYKDPRTLIHYLVRTAGMGANLLLNIGPQPDGNLPEAALERLKEIGQWMNKYGETFYATSAGDFEAQDWGTSTRKGDKLYLHVLNPQAKEIKVPTTAKVKKAVTFDDKTPVKFTKLKEGGISINLPEIPEGTIDYIIELDTVSK
ncbi:MAG: alpha-L-fucosidase [Paramuribaculum sp.]|nr:alpha-L-fucosidase [Paramuribaculum sp.]